MRQKYNLALRPLNISAQLQDFAQGFSHLAASYLLGEASLPHVTLYQFEIDGNDLATIWNKTTEQWKEKPLSLRFDSYSFINFYKDIFWLSLTPNHKETLDRMHALIASILQAPLKTDFAPHLTLINTKNRDYLPEIEASFQSYTPLSDLFILCLGKSDASGQLTEIIYQLPLSS